MNILTSRVFPVLKSLLTCALSLDDNITKTLNKWCCLWFEAGFKSQQSVCTEMIHTVGGRVENQSKQLKGVRVAHSTRLLN